MQELSEKFDKFLSTHYRHLILQFHEEKEGLGYKHEILNKKSRKEIVDIETFLILGIPKPDFSTEDVLFYVLQYSDEKTLWIAHERLKAENYDYLFNDNFHRFLMFCVRKFVKEEGGSFEMRKFKFSLAKWKKFYQEIDKTKAYDYYQQYLIIEKIWGVKSEDL